MHFFSSESGNLGENEWPRQDTLNGAKPSRGKEDVFIFVPVLYAIFFGLGQTT